MLMSATNKANFSDLAASGNLVSNDVNMTAAKEVTYVGSTSVFLGDFGTVEATPEPASSATTACSPSILTLCRSAR